MTVTEGHTSPAVFYGTIAVLLSTGGALILYFGLSWHPLISWLVSINLVAFLCYGFDKMQAKSAGTRIPERLLQALVLLGGAVGGIGAMVLFRHKIRKGSFQLIFWTVVALQVAAVCAWLIVR